LQQCQTTVKTKEANEKQMLEVVATQAQDLSELARLRQVNIEMQGEIDGLRQSNAELKQRNAELEQRLRSSKKQ
jgi:membrane-bound ClpP family serine protease